MFIRINQNISAQNAFWNFTQKSAETAKYLERLSTGLRINRAGDDPSGLAISERFKSQSIAINRAYLNAQDGISLLQTAESGLSESSSILDRLEELALEASNGTLTSSHRA